MNRLRQYTGLLLGCALLAPTMANARPKPLDPATVYARIAKRGAGSLICVQEANGIALVGRIVSIDDQSVGLQLHNYPEVTTVSYADIVGLRTGLSRGATWAVVGVGLGLAGAMAAVGFHEMNEFRDHVPTLPATQFP
jgi:hypothetical protein